MRRKPYTERGIKRVPCAKCGAPSTQSWTICAWPGYHAVCKRCDIELNKMVLRFFGLHYNDYYDLMHDYKKKLDALD